MSKVYDPRKVEEDLYTFWEERGYFRPQIDHGRKPFVISMPPPNVTGELHLGHALTAATEDLLIRWHRMAGDPTLWVPGSDHAGIATQMVVERMLEGEGSSRLEIGREEFLKRVWEWKERYGGIITQQHRLLGISCDWTRERFTLDKGLSRAVREAFVHLYDKGLIYKGQRLINWSPKLQTALSDLEVEHQQEEGRLYHFKYMLKGGEGEYVPVATTRPETILGDTAVAVHPEDERYRHLVGRTVVVPMLGREIPVIADPYVDMEFGTGALKITPAHDPHDYEIGQEHGLDFIGILNKDATLNQNAGPYAGLDRFEARDRLWEDMNREGLVIKEEPYVMTIPHSQRGGEIVEPMISEQWFVRIRPLAEPAMETVRDGRIRIVPERFQKTYFDWLENIRDWCISRQLWWGHRIPVWYCDQCGGLTVEVENPAKCAHCDSDGIHQDPDVLDTWFSSGLWPFSTLGWPDDTEDLGYFYPTSVMETAYDILFFWVARMIMMGLEFTGEVPFHTVYLHGLIRDEHGQKMSKSRGNVINPVEVIESYGTDALRFTLLVGNTPGNDMRLSEDKLIGGRNFANKLWQVTRFLMGNLEDDDPPPRLPDGDELTLTERWIISRYHRLTGEVSRLLEEYQFGEAGRQIHDFLWGEYCDWFVEASKIPLSEGDEKKRARTVNVLLYVLDGSLRLLHPFMPFITEEIWQHLPHQGEALIVAQWPQAGWTDPQSEADMGYIQEMITAIRSVRAEFNVDSRREIEAVIAAGDKHELVSAQSTLVAKLAKIDPEELSVQPTVSDKPDQAITLVPAGMEVYLPLKGMVDLESERLRLTGELDRAQREIGRVKELLGNEQFVAKAPEQVVEKEREKLQEHLDTVAKLEERLRELGLN
jgi:valyl-tRNA synthetase